MGGNSNLPLVSMIGIVLAKFNNHEKYVALNLVYFFTLYLKIFAADDQSTQSTKLSTFKH